ncbi:uncharacterized protein LOC130744215 [Lotus japonicus]|uniref:uncharacterized protein LOC130744215 n=1 Tax=Lotus japonicus TaxID=34305 RepID=UPI00258A9BB8|nr:uncharacterized protein LOC130744215 [Lotus japonicus]
MIEICHGFYVVFPQFGLIRVSPSSLFSILAEGNLLPSGAFILLMAPSPEEVAGMFATITEQLSSMLLRLDQNDTTVHQLSSQVAQLSSEQPAALAHNPTRTGFNTRADPTKALKLQLTQFDGTDPVSWVFQAEQYFQFLQIPGDQRLHLAAFYMKGEALVWYRWMHTNRQLLSWDEFVRNLTLRFGPSDFENPQQSLFKLQQTTTVTDYQTRFEKLCNQVVGLSPEMLLNCFISGLREDIKNDLKPLRPYSVSDAIGLAKMLEEKVASAKPLSSRFSRPATGHNTFTPGARLQSQPLPGATSTVKANPPLLSSPSLPIKRLTGAQMQERRALGLCYNCDEKFVVGHRCQPRLFLLMCDDTEDDDLLSEDLAADPTPPTFLHLSAHAFQGLPNPKTLTFQGAVLGHTVSVLVDTGSTHNVMPPRLARFLRLPTKPVPRFHVMVGNGNHIDCTSYCPDIALTLEGTLFHVSFYLLDIQGADLVLGMEWLRTLGKVTSDFSVPSMSFMVGDTQRTLIGRPLQAPLQASFQQLRRFWQHDAIAECHTIACFPHTTANFFQLADLNTCPAEFNTDIWHLLQQYSPVFATPQGLPPVRPQDHRITLLPGSAPVNVRPYSLNALTVKDRFPMLTIDELIDELGGSTIYSKIDLRSGFHQIRVVPEDTHKTAFRTVDGHYEFLVMPFGLTNVSSTFQAAMNDLLRPHLRKFVLVFFDDILIYSPDLLSHLEHLRIVLDSLLSNHFYAKLSKCAFGVATVDYLGHVITPTGIKPDASKVQAILDWPTPRSLTTLRGFLGLTGFYRRFVHHYATHATPLTDLLQTNKFKWTDTAEQAFSKLKSIMSSAPVLALPNFSIPFDVETDASGVAIGAVLAQQKASYCIF